MSLEFSLTFSENFAHFLKHSSSNLVNLQQFYQIWNSAARTCLCIHQKLPKSQNPGVISDPEAWIEITPKKVYMSSSTDQISVRPDQGVVHDHTTK